jgi:cellulose synthase/poly-beta-1,6-N-acetylglucosamine synthase-like glycosyltransferase
VRLLELLDLVLLVAATAAALPGLVLLIQCLAALLPARRRPDAAEAQKARPRPSVVVLVPAHDEALGIAATVRALLPELDAAAGDRLLVIADNCADDTAALARAAGATVLERADPARRGKGFAIQFAVEALAAAPPEVVVLLDADCRISAGGVARLARLARLTGRPIQAEYLLTAPRPPTPVAVIGALAVLVRNRARPRGMHRLGLPCQLTGSGMAFAWDVLRAAPPTGAHLVEDLVMGIELALLGRPPLLCPAVEVKSELPASDGAARKQRRRWEHGQLGTLLRHGPRLLLAGLCRLRPSLVALGVDLMVPPLALLVMAQLAIAALAAAALLAGASALPVGVAAAGLAAVAAAVLLAWGRFARGTLPLRQLLHAPLYLAWKVPLYLPLLAGRRQARWERTERQAPPPP